MELSIRLTSPTATFEEIREIFDPISDKYIIALENANSRHFQCYVNYIQLDDLKNSKLRYLLKSLGYKGNEKLSITKKKSDNLCSYVLKDGNYIYKGFTDEQIKDLVEKSYEKPVSYKKQKQILLQTYLDDKIKQDELIIGLIQLTTRFEGNYNRTTLIQYVNMAKMKKHPKLILKELETIKKSTLLV